MWINVWWTRIKHRSTITEPPFCNPVYRAQFCLKPLTSFFGIFCLDVLFTNMNFSRFLLHGENEMWRYTLLEAVAWSWRHSAQFSVAYFTKIIFLLLHWMSYMLYTSPGRGQSKVARVQDLWGKRRKTRSSHTIISISALNAYNNANFG